MGPWFKWTLLPGGATAVSVVATHRAMLLHKQGPLKLPHYDSKLEMAGGLRPAART